VARVCGWWQGACGDRLTIDQKCLPSPWCLRLRIISDNGNQWHLMPSHLCRQGTHSCACMVELCTTPTCRVCPPARSMTRACEPGCTGVKSGRCLVMNEPRSACGGVAWCSVSFGQLSRKRCCTHAHTHPRAARAEERKRVCVGGWVTDRHITHSARSTSKPIECVCNIDIYILTHPCSLATHS
jgi:hypothetical protein